jgi:hypothetical protein
MRGVSVYDHDSVLGSINFAVQMVGHHSAAGAGPNDQNRFHHFAIRLTLKVLKAVFSMLSSDLREGGAAGSVSTRWDAVGFQPRRNLDFLLLLPEDRRQRPPIFALAILD